MDFIVVAEVLAEVLGDNPHFIALAILNLITYIYHARRTAARQDKMWDRLNSVELMGAKHSEKLSIHGDHFTVLDSTHSQALDLSKKSLDGCFEAIRKSERSITMVEMMLAFNDKKN